MANHTHYAKMAADAKAKDGDAQVRAAHVAATLEWLDGQSLDGLTVDDDGVRVLVLRDQPKRGVPARTWVEAQGAA